MQKPVIEAIKKEELPAALEVLAKAFATQPSSLAIYKGRSQPYIEGKMQITFKVLLNQPGQVYVAKLEGQIVGVMRIVEWPNCQMKPLQVLKAMPALMRAGTPGEGGRAGKMRGTWAKKDPKEPHWHLDPLGVVPDLQGKGIGSEMMRFYCGRLDKLKMAAYHETDRPENVNFYERFGFKVTGEEVMMGFTTWYMWRGPV